MADFTVSLFLCLSLVLFINSFTNGEDATSSDVLSNDVIVIEPPNYLSVLTEESAGINITYNGTIDLYSRTVYVRTKVERDVMDLQRISLESDSITAQFTLQNRTWVCEDNCSTNVTGVFLGIAQLLFYECRGSKEICDVDTSWRKMNFSYEVRVMRREGPRDLAFTIVIVILGCLLNLGMGCKIDLEVVKTTLRRPIAPAIGFVCQFLFMPLLGFLFAKIYLLTPSEAIGVFSNGCSPGGGASNMWTLFLNGDVSLSITMTVISTVASLAMFPFWMFTLGRLITGGNFRIAYEDIVLSLIGIVIPSFIGVLIQKFRPTWSKFINKLLKPFVIILFIFIFTFGIWVNLFMFRLYNLNLILAGCSLPWTGYLLGLIVSLVLKRPMPHVIAIALETGIQNAGVSIITLRLSLPQPQNDMAIVGSIAATTFTPIPPLICLVAYTIWRRCNEREKKAALQQEMKSNEEASAAPSVVSSSVLLTQPATDRRKSMWW